MPDASVRPLGAQDVAAYRTLRLRGLRDHPHAFGADADEEAAWHADDWLRRLQRGDSFGAFHDGAMVGTAGFVHHEGRKNRHRGTLVGMYVAPEARGLGVGRALIMAVLRHAAGRVEAVELGVGIGNAPAIALYLACGFRPYAIDVEALRVGGDTVDEVLMRRVVGSR